MHYLIIILLSQLSVWFLFGKTSPQALGNGTWHFRSIPTSFNDQIVHLNLDLDRLSFLKFYNGKFFTCVSTKRQNFSLVCYIWTVGWLSPFAEQYFDGHFHSPLSDFLSTKWLIDKCRYSTPVIILLYYLTYVRHTSSINDIIEWNIVQTRCQRLVMQHCLGEMNRNLQPDMVNGPSFLYHPTHSFLYCL